MEVLEETPRLAGLVESSTEEWQQPTSGFVAEEIELEDEPINAKNIQSSFDQIDQFYTEPVVPAVTDDQQNWEADNADNVEMVKEKEEMSEAGSGSESVRENENTNQSSKPNYSALLNLRGGRKRIIRPRKNQFDDKGVRLYCICSKPDVGEFMIACDYCQEWYHGSCIGVTQKIADKLPEYKCPPCVAYVEEILRDVDRLQQHMQPPAPNKQRSDRKRKDSLDSDWDNEEIQEKSTKSRRRSKSSTDLKTSSSKPSEKKKSVITAETKDKLRRSAQNYFESTLKTIFENAKVTKSVIKPIVDLDNPKEFAKLIEEELFSAHSVMKNGVLECGPMYSSKFRNIQYNLKDTKNGLLRKRLLTGEITPSKLVQMSPEELANEEVKLKAQEIRNRTLLESVKTNDDGLTALRKTHKGEIEIDLSKGQSLSDMKITEKVSTPFVPPPKIQTLDEILETMSGKKETAPIKRDSISSEIQVSTPIVVDEAILSTYDEEVRQSEFISQNESGEIELHSPTMSPIDPPENVVDEDAFIWSGRVSMAQVGKFNGYCRQIAGRYVGDAKTWEDVLPGQISIDGRIQTSRVSDYVIQQKGSTTKEVVIVEFKSTGAAEEDEGFATLFDYFESKDRCAVIGHHYVSIKDMYIFPLSPTKPLPPFLKELEIKNRIPEERSEKMLLGVIILVKHFFRESSQKHSTTSSHAAKHRNGGSVKGNGAVKSTLKARNVSPTVAPAVVSKPMVGIQNQVTFPPVIPPTPAILQPVNILAQLSMGLNGVGATTPAVGQGMGGIPSGTSSLEQLIATLSSVTQPTNTAQNGNTAQANLNAAQILNLLVANKGV
ncbi:PHD finger protein 3 [Nowakowskiella sp. JEL0407]|nr:PHD finger protein 3 [Nowakowskiella sp. JEL0407]